VPVTVPRATVPFTLTATHLPTLTRNTCPAMCQMYRRPVTAKAWVGSQAGLCEICGGQIGAGTGLFPSTSVLPCQYTLETRYYSYIRN
jgi:hypothetical protein